MHNSLIDLLDTWQVTIFKFLPPPLFGILLMLVAVFAGLLVWSLAYRTLQRITRRWTFAGALLARTRRPSRMAVNLFVLGAVLPGTGFSDNAVTSLMRILFVGFVLLIGWCAVIASAIGSDIYLRRFRIDVDDNLIARKQVTQVRILKRAVDTLIVVVTISAALMLFPPVRQYGVSLLASAGAAGLVVGFAARPLLANLIAGVQIAITQPIRIDDAVVIQNEWGWIEEITSTYVVVKLWDWRRLILPLSYFIEQPFQNWTRQSAAIIGTVFLYVDYTVPVERVREKLIELAKASPLWSGDVVNLQVSDAKDNVIELRALVSATTSPRAWDLRCEMREKLIAFLQSDYPHALPRNRVMQYPQKAEADAAPIYPMDGATARERPPPSGPLPPPVSE